jgi:hypothetical protein
LDDRIVTLRALAIVPIIGLKRGGGPFQGLRLFLFYIYWRLRRHRNYPGV